MRSPGTAPVSGEILSAVVRATPRTGTERSGSDFFEGDLRRSSLSLVSSMVWPIAFSMSTAESSPRPMAASASSTSLWPTRGMAAVTSLAT